MVYPNPYLRTAAVASRYGPTAFKAGRKIARFLVRRYRKRQRSPRNANLGRRARQRVGEPVGSSNCKRNLVDGGQDVTARASKTMYYNSLATIDIGGDLNERVRDVVNLRGIKMCALFENTTDTDCLMVNVAVITRKDSNVIDATLLEDFFRASTTSRTANFSAASFSALEMQCNMINSDKYMVHFHWRFCLGAPGSSDANRPYFKLVKKWLPIKRQLRYDDLATEPTNSNLVFVYWAAPLSNARAATPVAASYNFSATNIMYYKEPGAR